MSSSYDSLDFRVSSDILSSVIDDAPSYIEDSSIDKDQLLVPGNLPAQRAADVANLSLSSAAKDEGRSIEKVDLIWKLISPQLRSLEKQLERKGGLSRDQVTATIAKSSQFLKSENN